MSRMLTDEEIIALYFARDEQAIAETAARYGAFCHRLSVSILHDEGEAEECVNDTYLQVWNTIPPQRPQSLRAYLGRIVRNLSLNRLRDLRREKRNQGLTVSFEELEDCIPVDESDAEILPELLGAAGGACQTLLNKIS